TTSTTAGSSVAARLEPRTWYFGIGPEAAGSASLRSSVEAPRRSDGPVDGPVSSSERLNPPEVIPFRLPSTFLQGESTVLLRLKRHRVNWMGTGRSLPLPQPFVT